jgi:hypothetical protein
MEHLLELTDKEIMRRWQAGVDAELGWSVGGIEMKPEEAARDECLKDIRDLDTTGSNTTGVGVIGHGCGDRLIAVCDYYARWVHVGPYAVDVTNDPAAHRKTPLCPPIAG